MEKTNNCMFCKTNYCLLEQKKCNKKNEDKCKILAIYKKKKENKGKDIWSYNRNLKCKKCGNLGAIQYQGHLYENGFSKEKIEKYPELYGKYWNKTINMGAIGYGGTIPWECCNCHTQGLVGMCLETYENMFEEINEK